ncbi:MAG TPA: hypothetical protein VHV30_03865 [Polyangiaceae bacterium]|jgi:hypothetical protein|nr:hypothetical protein [Polyangiaceae bacterium]
MGWNPPRRRFGAAPLIALGAVVACGRIGFDDVDAGFDASLVDAPTIPIDTSPPADDASDAQPNEDASDASEAGADVTEAGDDASEAAAPVCNPQCTNAHGTTSCANGVCVPVCASGFADCDGDLSNGCEANLDADPLHCGTCPTVCTADSGSPICNSGVCGSSTCAAGTGDCDKNPGNGCETNLDTSTANCRFCGNACTNANGSTSCSAGVCQPVCGSGFGDCDGNPMNGCETPTNTITNCGSCGHGCTSDAGTPVCNGGTCGTSCDLTGTWAVKMLVALSWSSSLVLSTGSGQMTLYIRLIGTQTGDTVSATLLPCGITVPDFTGSSVAGSELYGLTFPTTLFDHSPAFLPTTAATLTLSGTTPGSTATVPPIAFLVGTSLTNPTTAAWPSSPETTTSVDMDGDTKAGVTTTYKTGGSYMNVPVDFGKSARADKAYLAARVVTSVSATIGANCAGISGTATVSNFDTHILGCEIAGGTTDCTQTQSDFTDTYRPAYVAGAATLSMVRVAAGASCATVRGAL